MAGNGRWPTLIEVDLDEQSWLLQDDVASVAVDNARNRQAGARNRQLNAGGDPDAAPSGARWVLSNLGSDTHFATASVPGNKRYASQILEKQLRDEGVLEEPGNVLIHGRCKSSGDVFYTAPTIKQWMHYQQQEQDASDHRMIVPVAAVLFRQLARISSGITAVVFQHGCNFDILVGNRRLLVGADQIRAFSHLETDMDGALSNVALALQELAGKEKVEIDQVRWFCWRQEELDADSNLLSEDALALNLHEQLNLPVEIMSQDVVRIDRERIFRSSVGALMLPVGDRECVNDSVAKTLFVAEKSFPLVALLLVCVSMGLVFMSWQWNTATVLAGQEIKTIHQSINDGWQAQANQLLVNGERYDQSKPVKDVMDFVEEMKGSSDVPDLRLLLLDVQSASLIEGLRVTGVRMERGKKESSRVYIDGTATGGLGDTMVMVEKLRTAMAKRGYQADDSGDISNVAKNNRNGAFQVVLKWIGG